MSFHNKGSLLVPFTTDSLLISDESRVSVFAGYRAYNYLPIYTSNNYLIKYHVANERSPFSSSITTHLRERALPIFFLKIPIDPLKSVIVL